VSGLFAALSTAFVVVEALLDMGLVLLLNLA
jgi:hypothetical protein